MPNYSGLKVIELKELLKERDLGVSGTKSELVARLEEYDSQHPAIPDTNTVPVIAEATKTPTASTETTLISTTTVDTTSPAASPVVVPTVTTVPEEAPSNGKEDVSNPDSTTDIELVIAELQKRITRIRKYGVPEEAVELQKQIDRIRKLGLSEYKGANKILKTIKNVENSSVTKSKPSVTEKYNISEEVLAKRRARFATS